MRRIVDRIVKSSYGSTAACYQRCFCLCRVAAVLARPHQLIGRHQGLKLFFRPPNPPPPRAPSSLTLVLGQALAHHTHLADVVHQLLIGQVDSLGGGGGVEGGGERGW